MTQQSRNKAKYLSSTSEQLSLSLFSFFQNCNCSFDFCFFFKFVHKMFKTKNKRNFQNIRLMHEK